MADRIAGGAPIVIGVPRERADAEKRVALVPEVVKRLVDEGSLIIVERGAGEGSSYPDELYEQAGAEIVADPRAIYDRAGVVLKVQPPATYDDIDELGALRRGQVLVAFLAPLVRHDLVRQLRDAGVEAFDVRKVVKEQVESLGAKFVEVDSDEDAQTAGGYAKEVSEEYKKKQAEALARHVAKADVVICTALIPGKRAPILVTEEMVKAMKPGSVVVDLAAEQGGNCEGCEAGKTVVKHGVTIVGALDLPSNLAVHASQMWSRNMEKLMFHLTKDGALKLDMKDEITRGCLITHDGEVVQERVRDALAAAKHGPATRAKAGAPAAVGGAS
jgi:NAD(P) transhydrogenase subunit alpha